MGSKELSLMREISLILLSSALLACTLPSVGWWWLVFVALVPFLYVVGNTSSTLRALLLTMVFGSSYFIGVVAPLFQLTTIWWDGGGAFSVILLVTFAALYAALFFLPVTFLWRKYRTTTFRDVFLVALLFALIEYVRSTYALLGYGWGTIGYTLVDLSAVRGVVGLIGVYGASFLIVTINMFFVFLCEQMTRCSLVQVRRVFVRMFDRTQRYWVLLFVFVWVFAVIYGLRYDGGHVVKPLRAPLRVGVIVADSDDPFISGGLYRAYREKIIGLLDIHPETDIILFPENTFPFFIIDEETGQLAGTQVVDLRERDLLYADLLALSRKYSTTTLAVGLHTKREGKEYNTLVFYRSGSIIGLLHKQHLVPFFEYAPLGLPIPLFEPLTHGKKNERLMLFGENIGMLMCSEISDTGIITSPVDVILSPSNDGVFSSGATGIIHGAFARMRAIESGSYLVRANKGSISSIIDPTGNVLAISSGDAVLFETLR